MSRRQRKPWIWAAAVPVILAAVVGRSAWDSWAGRPFSASGRHAETVASVAAPVARVAAEDQARQERLLEQIETARQGLIAAQTALRKNATPVSRAAAAKEPGRLTAAPARPRSLPADLRLSALFGVTGSSLALAAVVAWKRRRGRGGARDHSSSAGSTARSRVALPAPDEGPGSAGNTPRASSAPVSDPCLPSVEELAPAGASPALEERLATLEESLLQLVKAVEEIASSLDGASRERGPIECVEVAREGAEPVPAPRGVDRAVQPASPREASPSEPADAAAGAPSSADGRDLARIRRAVLRLSAEGWEEERIASRLRLGAADVALIRKSRPLGPLTSRDAEQAVACR